MIHAITILPTGSEVEEWHTAIWNCRKCHPHVREWWWGWNWTRGKARDTNEVKAARTMQVGDNNPLPQGPWLMQLPESTTRCLAVPSAELRSLHGVRPNPQL